MAVQRQTSTCLISLRRSSLSPFTPNVWQYKDGLLQLTRSTAGWQQGPEFATNEAFLVPLVMQGRINQCVPAMVTNCLSLWMLSLVFPVNPPNPEHSNITNWISHSWAVVAAIGRKQKCNRSYLQVLTNHHDYFTSFHPMPLACSLCVCACPWFVFK